VSAARNSRAKAFVVAAVMSSATTTATVREILARLYTSTTDPPVMMSMAGKKGSMNLKHDPGKWIPVFRKRSCLNKKIVRDDDSKKCHLALAGLFASGNPCGAAYRCTVVPVAIQGQSADDWEPKERAAEMYAHQIGNRIPLYAISLPKTHRRHVQLGSRIRGLPAR
jgi:hypothetical protein